MARGRFLNHGTVQYIPLNLGAKKLGHHIHCKIYEYLSRHK